MKIPGIFASKTAIVWPFLLAGSIFVTGCVANVPYQAASGRTIRTVKVSSDIKLPRTMVFSGLSETLMAGVGAGLGGGVGAGLAAGAASTRAHDENLQIVPSLREVFADELQKQGRFKVVSGQADAELRIEVIAYGFQSTGPFLRRVRPLLGVRVSLVRADGTRVWKQTGTLTALSSKTPALLPENIRKDPRVGANALKAAARIVAADVIGPLPAP